jgi:PAS domain S-box-containing protein
MGVQAASTKNLAEGFPGSWELFRLITEAATDGIIVIDADSHIHFANPAAQQLFGYGPELLGQSLTILIPEPQRRRHLDSIARYRQTGNRNISWTGVEAMGLHRSGREIPVQISYAEATLRGEQFFVGYVRDITSRRQSEAVQAAVYQIAEAANKAESLDELYEALHGIIAKVMPARNFYIALYDSENDLISFPYHQDEVDNMWAALPLKPARGLTEYVLRTGQALYCDMTRFEELIKDGEVELVGPPSPIWLGVPLIVESKTIGVMALQDYVRAEVYGPAELQMLEFVSEQAAKAIERTRLLEEIQQHDRILSALQEATLTLMRELGLDEVLHVILTLAAKLMNTPHGFVCLVEPDESSLKVLLGLGRTAEFVGLELKPGEGLAGQIWQTGRPMVIQDYHNWTGRAAALEQVPYHAVAGVPLTSGATVIGVLGVSYVEASHTISVEAVELLNRFGQLASLALANARLYRAAQNELAERRQAEERLRASEERFRALIEHGADQISLLTPDGILTYENPTDYQPLGYPRGAFIGQNIFALLHPDDVERAREIWEQVLAQPGASLRSSFRLRHADGSWRWMEGTATNLLNASGVGAIVINYHDSTQRLQAEQALRDSEARFHSLVEHLPAITYTALMDEAHTRVYVSPQAEAMLGISLYDALADPDIWRKMLHRDDRERVLAEAETFYATGRPFVSDYRIVRADGQVFWFHDEAVIVEDKTSHVKFVHGVQMNVTERRQAEEEIRRLNAELEQRVHDRTAELEAANRELEAFSYSVSHDLRAPLRAIDGYTRLLGSDYGDLLPPEAHEYLKNIREGGRRMSLLIGDLLALSRVTRHVLNYQPVNLSNIAQAIADELQKSSPGRRADFIVARGLAAQADPGLVQILLQNLIGNAWKFSSKGEQTAIEFGALSSARVEPLQNAAADLTAGAGQEAAAGPAPISPKGRGETERGDGQVFFVRDNGAGFDMAHSEQLFHAFQRLHTNADFEGTGIGLTIVQRIVERHGGRVWAEGEVDKGAVFYFTL